MSEEVQIPVEAPVETDTVEQPVDILNDEGKFNESWRNALPDELGKHSIFEKYDNPLDLIKGSINAQSQVGKKAEEFWQSEDINDIEARKQIMGVPKNASEYTFELNNIPEGTEVDETRMGDFKNLAYDLGLSQKQAEALMNWEIESSAKNLDDINRVEELTIQESEEKLRKEWAGDKYEYNMGKVSNVMDYLGLNEFKDDPAIGNNVDFIKTIFEKVVPLIEEDKIIEKGMEQNYATISDQLSSIEQEMQRYEGNTGEHAYQQLIKERQSLLEKISR